MRRNAREEGQRWLAQAREDLKWAKHPAEVYNREAAQAAVALAEEVVSTIQQSFDSSTSEAET